MCQVLFILFPQKHLVRGQLLGGSHDTAAGVVRRGTARYGTVRGHYGWHRAQQTRTPSQCSEGAHPASHLPLETAPSRARPSVFAPPPRPPALYSRLPQLGLGARPGGGGLRAPGPGRHEGKVADVLGRRDWPRRGSRSRVRFTHCTSIYSARSGGAGGPREAPSGSALVIGGERRWLCAGPGLSSVGLPPASPSHSRRPAPSLGHRQSSRRGTCHNKAWASRGSRVLDHKCINLLRAFSTAMD